MGKKEKCSECFWTLWIRLTGKWVQNRHAWKWGGNLISPCDVWVLRVWLFLGITKSTEHENQFEPKEDSFILYKIVAVLMLRALKNNRGVASLWGFHSYLSLSGFSSTCNTLQVRLLQAKRGYYSLSRQTLSSSLVIFLILDCAESSTKTSQLHVRYNFLCVGVIWNDSQLEICQWFLLCNIMQQLEPWQQSSRRLVN